MHCLVQFEGLVLHGEFVSFLCIAVFFDQQVKIAVERLQVDLVGDIKLKILRQLMLSRREAGAMVRMKSAPKNVMFPMNFGVLPGFLSAPFCR